MNHIILLTLVSIILRIGLILQADRISKLEKDMDFLEDQLLKE